MMNFLYSLIKLNKVIISIVFSLLLVENNGWCDVSTINFTGSFNQAGCSVTSNSSLNIEMGDWFTSDFHGVGTFASRQIIPIKLDCNAGANIVATIQGDENSSLSGTLNLLSSGSGSAAGGVGVQLIDSNDKPLLLNEQFQVASNVNSGLYNFNWYARYIQTNSNISAGPANATATIVIDYK